MGSEAKEESSIMALAHHIHELQQDAVRQTLSCCSREVDAIVRLNVEDQQRIEGVLDQLLDVAFDDQVLVLFKKLCRHYYAVDPETVTFYVNSYREMWDEMPEETE